VIVKPATVIDWHRKGFRALWRRKCGSGRPRIQRKHIEFIKRISADHPGWGEDTIAEELAAKFGIHHAASTLRRYMVPRRPRPPRGDQRWHLEPGWLVADPPGAGRRQDAAGGAFVKNHASEMWSCDFLTQYTALFTVVYVFVVMEISSRRIVHTGVTTAPTLPWVKQQLREATAWGETPRLLIHDNDGIYGQYRPRLTVEKDGKKRSCRSHLDRWLDEVMDIRGLPIPSGAETPPSPQHSDFGDFPAACNLDQDRGPRAS